MEDRKREVYPLFHSLNGYTVRYREFVFRSQKLPPGLLYGCGGTRTCPSFPSFPGHEQEAGLEMELPGKNWFPYGMLVLTGGGGLTL